MSLRLGAATLLIAFGCAEGSSGATMDSGPGVVPMFDASFDSNLPRDTGAMGFDTGAIDTGMMMPMDAGMADTSMMGTDSGPVDSGPSSCAAGEHLCGSRCVVDNENTPSVGCRLGCGSPCAAPSGITATCGSDGQCTFECPSPSTQSGDRCVCSTDVCSSSGYECGAPPACGTSVSCGSCSGTNMCVAGSCMPELVCDPDSREPNNSRGAAEEVASLTDSPDTTETYSMFTIHTETDQDWFSFPVDDNADFGSPLIEVTLSNVPPTAIYSLAIYYGCPTGPEISVCTQGTAMGGGCTTPVNGGSSGTVALDTDCDNGGFDDSGTLFVHVRPSVPVPSCDAYELEVYVH